MPETAEKLRWLDENCSVCGKRLNSWDAKCSRALRYAAKRCESCIAEEYDMPVAQLRDTLEDYLGLRPCQGI